MKFHDPVPEPVAPPVEYQGRGGGPGDRVMGSDPGESQRQLQQEMQQLQIAYNDQVIQRSAASRVPFHQPCVKENEGSHMPCTIAIFRASVMGFII